MELKTLLIFVEELKTTIKKLNKMRTIINIEAIGYAYEAGSLVSRLSLSVE